MKTPNQNLTIIMVKNEDLMPALYNPRKWNKQAEKKLTESIKRFGFIDPIIANSATKRKNIIIGGHFRYQIALKLGFKEIPVVYVNIPSIKKRN